MMSSVSTPSAMEWTIELTLTGREVMGFRMLLGRQAIRGRSLVNPGGSFMTRRKDKKKTKTKKSSKANQ
jgi:hypothetical protein